MCMHQEVSFPSSDGVHTVYASQWTPDGEPVAVVQIVHGMAEYIDRYDDFARFLADNGVVVVGEDHLGHGKTARETVGFFAEEDGPRHVMNDIATLHAQTGARFAQKPYFLLGHSMGSFFARYAMILWPGAFSGVVLSGTGYVPPVAVKAARAYMGRMKRKHGARAASTLGFSMFNRQFAPVRTQADWISRDEAIVDAYVADPLCSIPTTYGMACDLLDVLAAIHDRQALQRMDTAMPVLLFSGEKDPVGMSGKGVRHIHKDYQRLGISDLQLTLYPEGRHEMLNEINRQQVYEDVLAWVKARC